MEIYLIRHTTPAIDKGICYGQTDLDLTNSFTIEAKKVLSQLPLTESFALYTSPLKRCKKLAKKIKSDAITDARLMELNFGKWENKKWDEIAKEELNPWMQDFVNVKVPNGESYIDLSKRVHAFFDDLSVLSHNKVFIVTHAGPMRAFLASIQNIPLKNSFSIKINYGDIITIQLPN
ncbi:alpha-ribazole phosphatase [Aquimarina sp. W85]|uniref:alpha-ribazole phosphatase n=1 Tax=Aquimarina rhodophyticola TaxID=3342246 RepID=UPI00366C0154